MVASNCHSGARIGASPESITTSGGYGFRACAKWRIYDVQLHIAE